MMYKLRLVQKFEEKNREAFLALEREFMRLEREAPEFPQGKRFLPYAGQNANCTLIWECEFTSMEELLAALDFMHNDTRHEALYAQQVKYFVESYTEIYTGLE